MNFIKVFMSYTHIYVVMHVHAQSNGVECYTDAVLVQQEISKFDSQPEVLVINTSNMSFLVGLVLLSTLLSAQGVNTKNCDDSNGVLAKVCYELFHTMEQSIYNDRGNLYRLRRAYFYAPNADPILIRVEYNITISNLENSSLPICTEDSSF